MMISKELIAERIKMFEDCKYCSIHKVQDYIKKNINNFDVKSKCGKCIAGFSLLTVLGMYQKPPSKELFESLEQNFYEFRDKFNR